MYPIERRVHFAGRIGASLLAVMASLAVVPALAKTDGKGPPPAPPPPCKSVSGPANFQCGAAAGDHIFLDKGKAVTSTTAEYPKANMGDNVAITLSAAADVADGFANIKPLKGGPLLTDITFTFTDPKNAVTGFLFRGQLNEHVDPIVVTVTDQSHVQQVFDYYVSSKSNPADIAALGISQALAGERIASISLYDVGGWFEGKQYEVTRCTMLACPTGGFGGGGGAGGIPEPASWALMLIGAAGVGALTRRRRSRGRAAAESLA